jgi:hypothetical protein
MVKLCVVLFSIIATGIGVLLLVAPALRTKSGESQWPHKGQNSEPTAFVTLVGNGTFIEGEPIEGKLTIVNDSDRGIEVNEWIPAIHHSIDGAALHFWENGRELPYKPGPMSKCKIINIQTPIVPIPPGETHAIPFILQRYTPQPCAGSHELTYTFELATPMYHDITSAEVTKADDENPRWPHIAVEGKLAIMIEPRDERRLQKLYQALVRDLDIDDPRRGDEVARAAEALSVLEDPLAIPYLIEAFHKKLSSLWWQCFFDALARFPNDEKAKAFMLERVSPGHDGTYTAQALDLLAKRKVELSVADVRRLLKSKDNDVWEATLRYIDNMRPKYNSLASNPD